MIYRGEPVVKGGSKKYYDPTRCMFHAGNAENTLTAFGESKGQHSKRSVPRKPGPKSNPQIKI